jgi:toxin-antitoxin system PIN domain toxin
MTPISLVDVNVVFAILVEKHTHHHTAWRWWQQRRDDTVVLTLPVKLGTLRLLTNKAAMEGSPVSPEEALTAWEKFEKDPRTRWLPEPGLAQEIHFRRFVAGRPAGPNLWTDAWLAALAEVSAISLTSFDTGFHSFGMRDFELLKG